MMNDAAQMLVAGHNLDLIRTVFTNNGKQATTMGTIELLSQLPGFATTKCEKKLRLPSRKVGGHGKIHALIQQKSSKEAYLAHCLFG